ncbi:MAG: hypothetical protein ABW061_08325, partial [Polyangiaceae bacterium]
MGGSAGAGAGVAGAGAGTLGGTAGASGAFGESGGAGSSGGTAPGGAGPAASGAAGGAGISGGAGGAPSACSVGTAVGSDIVVNLTQSEQTMDGFGVANTYQSTAITDAQADQFFDKDKGIGLSIFRLGIKSDGSNWGPISDAVKAAARGAVVWAAPWSPPANCKSNNSLTNGGHLNTSCYDSWASTLAAFPAKVKANGVTVMGISVQ